MTSEDGTAADRSLLNEEVNFCCVLCAHNPDTKQLDSIAAINNFVNCITFLIGGLKRFLSEVMQLQLHGFFFFVSLNFIKTYSKQCKYKTILKTLNKLRYYF